MKWDSNAYWQKAVLYLDRANEFQHATSEFPLWSALGLEFLARAALTKINPALNADPRDDGSLLYACGFPVTERPKSLPIHAVFIRLEKAVTGFGKTQRELCDYITYLRNEELHAAEVPFENLKESSWLPRYYDVCKILCVHLGKDLKELLGLNVAKSAERLIVGLSKDVESAVKGRIAEHRGTFQSKSAEEQETLRKEARRQQVTLSWRPNMAACICPACEGPGALRGDLIKEMRPVYEDETLLVHRELLATGFRCSACELELKSLAEIAHSTIEPRFIKEIQTDLHEMFEPELEDEYMNM